MTSHWSNPSARLTLRFLLLKGCSRVPLALHPGRALDSIRHANELTRRPPRCPELHHDWPSTSRGEGGGSSVVLEDIMHLPQHVTTSRTRTDNLCDKVPPIPGLDSRAAAPRAPLLAEACRRAPAAQEGKLDLVFARPSPSNTESCLAYTALVRRLTLRGQWHLSCGLACRCQLKPRQWPVLVCRARHRRS
jgi:hypothetical protein